MYLSELIQAYYEYRPHASKENEVLVNCPFCADNGHSPDTEFKLGVNTQKELGHCHRCDWRAGGRNLYSHLAEEANVHECYETDTEEHTLEKPKKTEFTLKRVTLPKEFEPLWQGDLDSLGRRALKYLTDRGITEGQLRRHKIGFCGTGKYGYRILLPITFKGICVSFTARSFVNAEPKYLISDGEKFLYGWPTKRRKTRCLLVEGPFDVLNVEHYTKDFDVLGKQGSVLTDLQVKALSRYEEIVIWNDPDEPGVEGAIATANKLKEEVNSVVLGVAPIGSCHDPGDMDEGEVNKALANIRPWSSLLVNRLLVSVIF